MKAMIKSSNNKTRALLAVDRLNPILISRRQTMGFDRPFGAEPTDRGSRNKDQITDWKALPESRVG